MKYNFDALTNRVGTYCYKWDETPNVLPMTIADMDFEIAPRIKESVLNPNRPLTTGYSFIPDAYYEAIASWWNRRHNLGVNKDHVVYTNGVICAISSIVRRLSKPGDNVLLQFPIYNTFFNSVVNNDRVIVSSDLVYKDGEYTIDWEDLERVLADEKTTLWIICNPHNPIGKNWSKEELAKMGELARKHGVVTVSDEIHCDVQEPGNKYTSFLAASIENYENGIVLVSTSKTFNMAGFHAAAAIIPNKDLRYIVWRGVNTDECAEPNFFSIPASLAAYNESEDWVEEVNAYMAKNKNYVRESFKDSKIKVVSGPATYLLWLDISELTDNDEEFAERLEKETGLQLNAGSHYRGKGFLRMNVATQKSRVEDAVNRLKNFIK